MSSISRNTLRADSTSRRALGAGLALTLLSGTALAGGAHRFVFTAYSDAAGGVAVVNGRYRAALTELKDLTAPVDLDPAATNTNRCVAYSMTAQWQQARIACDAAVRAADRQRTAIPDWLGWTPASSDERLALAYANRAVMLWLSHDGAAAQRDLARAQELAPVATFVAQNAEALKMHGPVTLAAAPPPRS